MELTEQLKEYQGLELHRNIGTKSGFFKVYFDQLKNFTTQSDTFNHVNDTYKELFGEFRYDSYESFRRALTYYNKNK